MFAKIKEFLLDVLRAVGVATVVVVFTAFVLLLVAAQVRAETQWKDWGVAPYAASQEEACKKAPAAIDGFDLPPAVKQHFKQTLGTTCKGGREAWLTPHMHIEQMWSGGGKPHVTNKVTVAELPVAESPTGRTYRKGAVAETVKTLSWTFGYEGKSYVLYLPFVCFNWSWAPGAAPHMASAECVELAFNAPVGGNVRWGIGTRDGPLPPSACNAQRQGNEDWTSWLDRCDWCNPSIDYVRQVLGNQSAEFPQKFKYAVTARTQTLRFPMAVLSKVVYICLEDAKGGQTCGVYVRPQDWQGRTRIEIPDSIWETDYGRCPQ